MTTPTNGQEVEEKVITEEQLHKIQRKHPAYP